MTIEPESAGTDLPACPDSSLPSSLPASQPRFPLGRVVATPAALALLEAHGVSPWVLVRRHQHLEPGELGQADQEANEIDLATGGRIFSKYAVAAGHSLYVITEVDRSVTTILLPTEY
jgi:hypothetical protein